jgi:hypothetical protein
METEATAAWPAIDPQTWRPRGLAATEAPVAVTVDPRDEEHSLMLAIRKLSADAALRAQLGRAAHAWSETHATLARAASAWTAILGEATTLSRRRGLMAGQGNFSWMEPNSHATFGPSSA